MRKMRRNLTFLYDLHILCVLSKINVILHLIFFALQYLPSHSNTEKNLKKYIKSMLDQLDMGSAYDEMRTAFALIFLSFYMSL